jgi:hypothetical protein
MGQQQSKGSGSPSRDLKQARSITAIAILLSFNMTEVALVGDQYVSMRFGDK